MVRKIFIMMIAVLIVMPALSASVTAAENIKVKEIVSGLDYKYPYKYASHDRGYVVNQYSIYSFYDGLANVIGENGIGVIDKTGKLVIDCIYTGITRFRDGFAIAEIDSKYSLIDRMGKVIREYEYDMIKDYNEGLAAVAIGFFDFEKNDAKWGYMNIMGEIVIPIEYDYAWGFYEGLAVVQKGGKFGYIDKTGKAVTPFEYESAWAFNSGVAIVWKNGKWGVIDKTGKVVVPIENDANDNDSMKDYYNSTDTKIITVGEHTQEFYFYEGLARLYEYDDDNKIRYGYIDKTGNLAAPCIYDGAYDFNEGLAFVWADEKMSILQIVKPETKDIVVRFGATKYILNGEPFDEQTMVYEGAAYLPAAYLATKLGLSAKWDAETNTTALTSTGAKPPASSGTSAFPAALSTTRRITATFGATKYILNGEPFDEQTIVYNGVAYLPAAYLATKLGLTAQWDAKTNITTLTSEN